MRPPQRLQVQASLRVRRGLLLFDGEGKGAEAEAEAEREEELDGRKAPPPGAARPPLVPRIKTRGADDGGEEAAEAERAAGAALLGDDDEDSTTEYSVTSKKAAAAAEHSASPPPAAAAGRAKRDAAEAPPPPLRAGGPVRGLKREGESRDRWSLSGSPPPSVPGLVLANAGGRGEGTRPGPPRRGRWTTKFCLFVFVVERKWLVLEGGSRSNNSSVVSAGKKPQLGQRRASSELFLPSFLLFFGGSEPVDVTLPLECENTAKRERRASTKATG